jgi:maleate isomerase
MDPAAIQVARHPLALDERPVPRRVGLVVLATDHTTERDFGRMLPRDEVGIYVARVPYANPTAPENLCRLQPRLAEAAALILPGEPLDALHFGCTSAVVAIGDEAVEAALQDGKPGAPVVTPLSAARAAFEALGVHRIGLLTPYTPETTASMADYFAGRGFTLRGVSCLGLEDDRVMARIRPEVILAAAVEAMAPDAEGLFVSCTALRAAEVAERIEEAIGRPVVTSNQASVWRCLRLLGLTRPLPGYGRLLRLGHQE